MTQVKKKAGETLERYDIEALRRVLGVSQAEAADKLGITARTWQRNIHRATIGDCINLVLACGGKFEKMVDLFQIETDGGRTGKWLSDFKNKSA